MALQGARPRLEALVLAGGERLGADRFILATGGASYPRSGTRGEVLGWLEALGVPVAPWFPPWPRSRSSAPSPAWEGVALRDGVLNLKAGPEGRLLAAHAGDLLFTRAGVSGPAALELSRAVEAARRSGGAWLSYAMTGQGRGPAGGRTARPAGAATRTWRPGAGCSAGCPNGCAGRPCRTRACPRTSG